MRLFLWDNMIQHKQDTIITYWNLSDYNHKPIHYSISLFFKSFWKLKTDYTGFPHVFCVMLGNTKQNVQN